jgi:hypothetical protein
MSAIVSLSCLSVSTRFLVCPIIPVWTVDGTVLVGRSFLAELGTFFSEALGFLCDSLSFELSSLSDLSSLLACKSACSSFAFAFFNYSDSF